MNTHQTPTFRYLIEAPGGLGVGEVEATSLSRAREVFAASLPDRARCSNVRVFPDDGGVGVGIVTVTTAQGQDIDVRITRLS